MKEYQHNSNIDIGITKLHSAFLKEERDLVNEIYHFITEYPRAINRMYGFFIYFFRKLAPNKFGSVIGYYYTKKINNCISDDAQKSQLFHLPLLSRGSEEIINSIVRAQYRAMATQHKNDVTKKISWKMMYVATPSRQEAALAGLLSSDKSILDTITGENTLRPEIKQRAMSIACKNTPPNP